MTRVTFVSGSANDASNLAADPSRMLNCHAERATGRTTLTIRPDLGLTEFADLGAVLLRDMAAINGRLYAVTETALHAVSDNGAVDALGTIQPGDFVTISGNLDQVIVTAGGVLHVYNGGVVRPAGGAFADVQSAALFDYYTVMTGADGRFQWSSLADATTLAPLNVASAEADSDTLLRAMAAGRELWLFGERTTEIWPNSGQAGAAAFSGRLHSINTGLRARQMVTRARDGFFFVGNDGVCYATEGMSLRPLPNPAIERANIDRCFYYEDGHHRFCVVRLHDAPAWKYDLSTGLWSERGTDGGAWEVIAAANCYGKWYAGTNTGRVYEMARTGNDAGRHMVRRITAMPMYFAGRRFTVDELEVLIAAQPAGSSIMLETSRDGGATWSDTKTREVAGRETRAVWRRLGQFRQCTVRISMSDMADTAIYSDGNVTIA